MCVRSESASHTEEWNLLVRRLYSKFTLSIFNIALIDCSSLMETRSYYCQPLIDCVCVMQTKINDNFKTQTVHICICGARRLFYDAFAHGECAVFFVAFYLSVIFYCDAKRSAHAIIHHRHHCSFIGGGNGRE